MTHRHCSREGRRQAPQELCQLAGDEVLPFYEHGELLAEHQAEEMVKWKNKQALSKYFITRFS